MKIVDNFKKVIEVPQEGIKTRGEKISIPHYIKEQLEGVGDEDKSSSSPLASLGVLISEKCLALRVKELAQGIAKEFSNGVYLVSVLKGSVIFVADLMRNIEAADVGLDFISVSSYVGAAPGKKLRMGFAPENMEGKDVVLVEDILDTGNTAIFLKDFLLKKKKARSVKICALLDKPSRREKEVEADFAGFSIPDCFVVGYGLDYDQCFRNLPFVASLKNY